MSNMALKKYFLQTFIFFHFFIFANVFSFLFSKKSFFFCIQRNRKCEVHLCTFVNCLIALIMRYSCREKEGLVFVNIFQIVYWLVVCVFIIVSFQLVVTMKITYCCDWQKRSERNYLLFTEWRICLKNLQFSNVVYACDCLKPPSIMTIWHLCIEKLKLLNS